MSTVELSFSALPVHVRTARLIVTAVARRSGVAGVGFVAGVDVLARVGRVGSGLVVVHRHCRRIDELRRA